MADETLTRREVFSWAAALPHKEDADFILAHDAALRARAEKAERERDELVGCKALAYKAEARAERAERERDEARLALNLSSWPTFNDRLTALAMHLAPKAKNIAGVIETAADRLNSAEARAAALENALREIEKKISARLPFVTGWEHELLRIAAAALREGAK